MSILQDFFFLTFHEIFNDKRDSFLVKSQVYSFKGAHLTSDQDAAPQLMEQVCRDYEQKHLKNTDVYSYMLYSDWSYKTGH